MQERVFRKVCQAEDPRANNYWQRVAAWLPGRTADQCYAKVP